MSKLETIEIINEQNSDTNRLLTSTPSLSTSSSSTFSETTVLIDPISGLLIPMQESDEGQYVSTDNKDLRKPTKTDTIIPHDYNHTYSQKILFLNSIFYMLAIK
ncbi:Hypothetical protein CINCED_3A003788 [Cinara cedri]|uniref:Uncharacterized protein n=1 Tax=Cinara cedri TaxID=506608 RepID=A0A5E4MZK8_9HEMI|nr:Hypothetical protein CINCED_3A003788 [Cinara cedri]